MKFNIKKKAKSALSFLLTLCMLLSCVSVGIFSVSAAEVDVAEEGYFWDGGNYYLRGAGISTNVNKGSGTGQVKEFTLYLPGSSSEYKDYFCFKEEDGSGHDGWIKAADGAQKLSSTSIVMYVDSNKKDAYIDRQDLGTKSWYKVTVKLETKGTIYCWYEKDSGKDALTTTITTKKNGTATDYFVLDDTVSISASSSNYYGSPTYTYEYKKSTASTYTSISSGTSFTPSTAGTYDIRVTAKDSWIINGTNASSDRTKTVTKQITVVPKLDTPSVSNISVNSGDNAVFTISNHDTIVGKDASVTYEVYKGGTAAGNILTAGTDYTYSNSTVTITGATSSNADTYYFKAKSSDTTRYGDSDMTSGKTLSVYSPEYCLVGNVNRDALSVGGSTYNPTTPSGGDNTWWNTWQSGLQINQTTETAGKYSFTFKVNEECDRDKVNLGLLHDNGDGTYTQRAFILNGTEYNTSAHGDITVPDDGILFSGNLYAYPLADSDAGGSLVLKKGQTYTITIDQTQQYDSSSPYGKIQIEASDYFVDTVAKKQNYSATNRNWEAVTDASSTVGTVSAQPVHGPKGSFNSTLLTAVVANANYEFIGWYSDPDCENDNLVVAAENCTSVGSTYTCNVNFSGSTTYYALFKHTQPSDVAITVIQPNSDEGEFTITAGARDANSTGNNAAYPGATVSLTATPYVPSGGTAAYEFSHWKILNTATQRDATSLVMNNSSAASSSFTMPSYPVTVTAVFRERTQVNISVVSNNTALGTAARGDSNTYYVGDTNIPIAATPVGQGAFLKWQISGGTLANANNASTTFTATASNVTIKAIFEYKTYQLYYNGKYLPLIRQSDGTYVSSFKIPSNSSTFTIYNKSDNKYAVAGTGSGNWQFNSGTRVATIYNKEAADDSAWAASTGQMYKNTSEGAAAYLVFHPPGSTYNSKTYNNGLIRLVTTNPAGDIAQIYAKDGSIRYASDNSTSGALWENSKGGPTCNRGVTKITKIDDAEVKDADSSRYPGPSSGSDHLKIYSAPIGSTITIQTTMNDTYKSQGFYVGMFVVNGWKVNATDNGKGVYTATYTLSDDYYVPNRSSEKTFEITPVYYNKNFEYITFYVDAASVPSDWGNTISACATYNGATNSHFEGTYPGQPLGREGDLYEMKVSKYYYDYNSTTKVWTQHPNYQPAATITAYNYDNVHHYYYVEGDDTLDTGNNNFQTYDYSDFAFLAKIKNIQAILFKCMKETAKTNRDSKVNNTNTIGTSGVRPNDGDVNTYHLLTDYYGNPIDALGNRIPNGSGGYYTAADAASWNVSNAQIKIVSYGNISNDKKKSDTETDVAYKEWRTKGNWITAWKVFAASTQTTPIAVGSPADFINVNANTTQAASYGLKYFSGKGSNDLSGKKTFISYENQLENVSDLSGVGTDTGKRIDGQWYYSAMSDFTSEIKVAYTTAENAGDLSSSNTTLETDTNSSSNTGFIGNTSGTKATLDGVTSKVYSDVTTESELSATVGNGYMFVGWYIKNGDNYVKIHDNFTDINTTITMKKNYTIVAVVKEVPSNAIVLTHNRYSGSVPVAHNGTGKYYISAVVTHADKSTTKYAEAQNILPVNLTPTDKIQITLRTVCSGDDTFYAWYEEALGDNYARTGNYYEICDEGIDPMGEKEVSYTFDQVKCDKFFGTTDRKSIDFYSDITHVSAYASITYKYYDRFSVNGANQMASYTVKDIELSSVEIENNYIPSDDTIERYAPDVIDTIYKNTRWVVTDVGNKVERLASNVTVMATQDDKDCFVKYIPADSVSSEVISNVGTVPVDEIAAWTTTSSVYNSLIMKDGTNPDSTDPNDFLISAPETLTKNNTTYTFSRFDVYRITDRVKDTLGDVIYSCNDSVFGYRVFTDCAIYPVYVTGAVENQLTARIEPAVLNREVFGANTSLTDKLYADLVVSYLNASSVDSEIPIAIKEYNGSKYTIETGMIVDRAKVLSDNDYNYLSHLAEEGSEDVTQDILLTYNGGYTGLFTTVNGTTAIESLAKGGTSTLSSTYSDGSNTHSLSKYVNDNSKLTNKNRIDKVLKFNNSESARHYVFAAYSYVVITNTDTHAVLYALSDPQYFNFCYIGSKPTETSAS